MPGEKNEGATRVADQGAGGPYDRHRPSLRTTSVSRGIEVEILRSVIATRRAAMVSAMAMPGTARDPLRSHSFTQCRSTRSRSAGGDDMLAKHPIDVMLMATDLEAARRFYGDRVGLDVLIESDDFVTFGCGGDSRLVVTRTSSPSGEQQTKASWRVTDVVAEVAELRVRGVDVVEYDEPYLKTVDGVADVGFALSAWFVDPGGNTIGLLQFKDKESG
jgi:extradiol dioxygenase family protein